MVNRHGQSGFTVVEVACAFAIVTVLAVGLMQSGHSKTQSIASAFHETLALRLCQAELERVRTESGELVVGEHELGLPDEAGALPNGRAVRVVRAVPDGRSPDGGPGGGLFEVEVIVDWQVAGAANPTSVRLVTRVACAGGGR